jgi:hypothetical protein
MILRMRMSISMSMSRASRHLLPGALAAALLAALLTATWLAPGAAQARAPRISVRWSDELVADGGDKKQYEALLRRQVTAAYRTVRRGFGFDLPVIQIRLYTPRVYARSFGSSGAMYYRRRGWAHGVIRVNGGARLNQRFGGRILHEMVHAFIDARRSQRNVPLCINEGVAELYRWRYLGLKGLSASQVNDLKQAQQDGELIPLPRAGPFNHLQYLRCYGAMLFMERKFGGRAIGRLLGLLMTRRRPADAVTTCLGMSWSSFEKLYAGWVQSFP